jgi:hypothetical protein
MTLHKITEFCTEWFSVYHNTTSKFRTITIFKNASNKRMIQIKLIGMSMISYCTKVRLSKYNGSWVVSTEQTMNFNIQLAAMFVFFVSDKNCLTKSCSSFEELSIFKTLRSHVDWCKFCIHLRRLNDRHFGTGWRYRNKKYGIEVTFSGMTSLLNFIKSTNCFKSYYGGHTDRQTGDLISLTFLFKESRVKKTIVLEE